MFATVAGTRITLRPLWRSFVLSMLTGSLYQLWWMYCIGGELAALTGRRAQSMIERCVVPIAVFGGYAGILAIVMHGRIDALDYLGLIVCACVVGFAVHHEAARVYDAERNVGIHRDDAERLLPVVSVLLCLLIGGAQAVPDVDGRVDLPSLLLGGVIAPCWLLIVQYRMNRVLERMKLTSDDAENWNYGSDDVVSVAVRSRITAFRRRQDADAQLDIVPWVTITLAAICSVVFAWQLASFGLHLSESELRRSGAMSLDLVHEGQGWRLLTMHITHASVGHWAGNMFALSLTGWLVERTVGHRGMIAVIVAGMAGSTLFDWFLTVPLYGPRAHAMLGLGESGIGLAVVGAMWGIDRGCHSPIGKFGRAMAILCGVSSLAPGVGILAHAGGFVAGFAIGFLLARQQQLDFVPRVVPMAQVLADVRRALGIDDDAVASAATAAPATAQPAVVQPPMIAPPAVVTPPAIVPPPPVQPPQLQPPSQMPPVYRPGDAA